MHCIVVRISVDRQSCYGRSIMRLKISQLQEKFSAVGRKLLFWRSRHEWIKAGRMEAVVWVTSWGFPILPPTSSHPSSLSHLDPRLKEFQHVSSPALGSSRLLYCWQRPQLCQRYLLQLLHSPLLPFQQPIQKTTQTSLRPWHSLLPLGWNAPAKLAGGWHGDDVQEARLAAEEGAHEGAAVPVGGRGLPLLQRVAWRRDQVALLPNQQLCLHGEKVSMCSGPEWRLFWIWSEQTGRWTRIKQEVKEC